MEDEKTATKQIIIKHGVVLGVVSILFSAIIYATGIYKDPHWSIGILGLLILLGAIVYGIKAYKTRNSGFLNLTDALKVGIGIALIGGILSAIWNTTLTTVIEPDYTKQVMEIQREKTIEKFPDMPKEQIEQTLAITEKLQTPAISFALGLIGSLFMGFIISLISGLVMQKKQDLY